MQICHECRKPILPADLVWGSRLLGRQDFDCQPFHNTCLVEHGREASAKEGAARHLFLIDEGRDSAWHAALQRCEDMRDTVTRPPWRQSVG